MAITNMLIKLLLIISFSSSLPCNSLANEANTIGRVPALFVFGSSVVDNGNNHYLNTTAKADYYPYGVDFPSGPTGRFTNGANIADVMYEFLKLPGFLPAFSNPMTKGKMVLNGVNFGSGGAGILDDTAPIGGGVISLTKQISNFEKVTLVDLKSHHRLVRDDHRQYLSRSFFFLSIGGNDYLLNYFQGKSLLTLQSFTKNLITKYSEQLTRLYALGARKFVVQALNPSGCAPVVMEAINAKKCVDPINQASLLFNSQLMGAIRQLKSRLPGSHFVFINSYPIMLYIIDNPHIKGFRVTDRACCKTAPKLGICLAKGSLCKNRDAYVFFDGLHTTSAVNKIFGKMAFTSTSDKLVYPFNLAELAKL